ncbi:Dam family site-specific DNA-(adenine-N6)-methyltransferase [Flavobacteriaceae bacterium KMM 6898]|nr:Dam family site-specific DNA-(adenine-N6)-methyltransferase [Flavobacteriaceae bacterium KMM 6898]
MIQNEKKIKPFLRWAGGKQKQLKQISPYFPNEDTVNTYFEPFIGGGTLFLNKDFKRSYISDVNKHLINTYEKIKKNPERIYKEIQLEDGKISESEYYKIRDEFNKNKYSYTYRQAANFILLNKSSFNGIFRVNKKGEYNVPFGEAKPALPSINDLLNISKKLESSEIQSHTFERINGLANQDDLVYLDPPYPPISQTAFFQHYTKKRFHLNDQEKVFLVFENLANENVRTILSYPDLPLIRKTYEDYNIIELSTFRSVRSKGETTKIKELIIRNF